MFIHLLYFCLVCFFISLVCLIFDVLQIAETLGHLSTAYIDLGNPALSVSLLQRTLDINKQVHGSNHITEAITLSQLSNAYYHLGDLAHSEQYAKEALALVESTQGPLHFGKIINNQVWWSLYKWPYCNIGEGGI